jgi:hypothetical protein
LQVGAELVAVGVPLSVTQDEVAALRDEMARVAGRFVGLFERYVWAPFAEAGMPAERLGDVTDALRRLRPLAAIAVRATLAQAMEEATTSSTASQVEVAGGTRPLDGDQASRPQEARPQEPQRQGAR